MLLERDRKLFHLFAVISIALSLLVCIPYSLEKVTELLWGVNLSRLLRQKVENGSNSSSFKLSSKS